MDTQVSVYLGKAIANYGFDNGHPFSRQRHGAFESDLRAKNLEQRVKLASPSAATEQELAYFHTLEYIQLVKQKSISGEGYLDAGDTPAFVGAFEAAGAVAGTTLAATREVMSGKGVRAFVPIAGLHHARPDRAGGFCIFNDCAIAAVALFREYGLERVAYVDIDAHHGDGVYYGFESDPALIFADTHEHGRYLYPGTGNSDEVGLGDARGTKLNIPLPPGAGDDEFFAAWERIETHLVAYKPQFFLLQCGADSLAQDPLTHLEFSAKAHAHAARRLCALADEYAHGRVVAMGGGGYNLENLAQAWTGVVEAMLG